MQLGELDAKGLGVLLRNGMLPEAWIPPRELQDQRELPLTVRSSSARATRFSTTNHERTAAGCRLMGG